MQTRLIKLRFRRRIKQRQKLAKEFGEQAELGFERYFLKRFERLRLVQWYVISWLLLIGFLMAGVTIQAFGLGHYYKTLQPVAGGTYREGVLGTFSTANPLYATNDVDTTVARLVFAGLFQFDQNNKLIGDLASGYEVNANGTVYTVKIKSGMRWQDGRPLTSADVLFTYKAIQNPDAQSPLRSNWQGVIVTAPNPATVVFSLPGPLASFPNTMINGIVPEHILAKVPAPELRTADFNTVNPIGAGPFRWQAIEVSGSDPRNAEEQIELAPYVNYQAGSPKLEKFIVHAYADRQKLIADFDDNAINAIAGLSAVPDELARKDTVQSRNLLLTAGTYTFFKTTHPILSSQKVRQALVQGADPSAIIKQLPFPTKPVRGPLLAGQLSNDPALSQPKPDLNAAKALLDADGWKPGPDGIRIKDKQKLTFKLVATDTAEYRQVTKMLQQQWRRLGVQPDIRLQTVKDFQNTLASHDYDAVLYGISIGPDPDVFVYWDSTQTDVRSTTRLNLSEYKNPIADAALEAGRTRLNPELRTVKYRPFLQAWQQDLPALGLYQPRVLYLTNITVSGLEDQTINSATDRFNNVQNWMIREARITNN